MLYPLENKEQSYPLNLVYIHVHFSTYIGHGRYLTSLFQPPLIRNKQNTLLISLLNKF